MTQVPRPQRRMNLMTLGVILGVGGMVVLTRSSAESGEPAVGAAAAEGDPAWRLMLAILLFISGAILFFLGAVQSPDSES